MEADLALTEDERARGPNSAALIGATLWGLFFLFVLLIHTTGLLTFPQIRAVSIVFIIAVGVNAILAMNSRLWALRSAVYLYEGFNAILVTIVLTYVGGSMELGIAFACYAFFVVHTCMVRADASPFVTAIGSGIAYGGLAVAETAGWVAPIPVLHRPPTAGERIAFAVYGLLALISLAFYASRYAAERRRLADRLSALVVERTSALTAVNAELAANAGALEASKKELEDFVYTVTHDLKTPMSNVLLLADLLLDGDHVVSADVRAKLERIRQRAGDAENMITDLWKFLQITSPPEPARWLNFADVVTTSLTTLTPQLDVKGIRVAVATLPRVWGQPKKLAHVMMNLLSNAVKFTPDRGGVIEIGSCEDPGSAVIFVRDNGSGIPADYHQRIFELFGQAPYIQNVCTREQRGTGVGLAIVKRIIEEHGGAVWVESAPGGGSCFWLRLVQPDRADADAPTAVAQ